MTSDPSHNMHKLTQNGSKASMCDIRFGNAFLYVTPKAQAMKELDFMKTENQITV